MISRRALLWGAFAEPEPARPALAPTAPGSALPEEIEARARAFRDALASRPRGSEGPKLAVVAPRLCLLSLGTECSVCAERCPEPGAIVLRDRAVVVDPARCTGCGECVDRCPAPIPALALRKVS